MQKKFNHLYHKEQANQFIIKTDRGRFVHVLYSYVSELLGVSERSVRRWVSSKSMPYVYFQFLRLHCFNLILPADDPHNVCFKNNHLNISSVRYTLKIHLSGILSMKHMYDGLQNRYQHLVNENNLLKEKQTQPIPSNVVEFKSYLLNS